VAARSRDKPHLQPASRAREVVARTAEQPDDLRDIGARLGDASAFTYVFGLVGRGTNDAATASGYSKRLGRE
jgi:hypothetical protein